MLATQKEIRRLTTQQDDDFEADMFPAVCCNCYSSRSEYYLQMCIHVTMITFVLQRQFFSPEYLALHGNMVPNCRIAEDESIDCTFASRFQRLLSVPLGVYQDDVVAEITLGINPKYANIMDSDFFVLLSDGSQAVGFIIPDHLNYGRLQHEPCFHVQATPGESLSNIEMFNNGPRPINASNPVPATFTFLISSEQKMGSCLCSTAYEGSYTTAKYYPDGIQPVDRELTLDIYSEDDEGEQYNFRYIAVDISLISTHSTVM